MKIAIDLNDVVRDFSTNFLKYYCERYTHEFDLNDFEYWTNDMAALFPFASDNAYLNFTYSDYAYELFGKCDTCDPTLVSLFGNWADNVIPNMDLDEPIELMIVSPKEYGLSIGATLFFLSKIGCPIREIYFPNVALTIWDKCDVLITANPDLLKYKPEGKIGIKIKQEYNKEVESDYDYPRFTDFLKDEEIVKKLAEKNNS